MPSEPIRVLLVEDNLGDARLLYEGLEEALPGQFHLTHVRRLSEALECLWKEACDVVLLDLGLPDSHGIDTLILTHAQAPAAPIVVLTGYEDESLGDQALKEGAQDYLVKGQVDSQQLARSMRYAIARKAANEALIGQGVALAKAGVLQRSRQRLIAANERVRRDIAARLHDGVYERLVFLQDRLEELLKGLGSASETTRFLGDEIERLNQTVEQEADALGRRLFPSTLSEGLVSAIHSLRDQYAASLALNVDVAQDLAAQLQADAALLPDQVALAAYRIAEEALANVVAHAKAGKADVRLESPRPGCLRLTVCDDGQGFDTEHARSGLGMGTMQDYAESVNGEFSVHSEPGAGTAVTALLPLSQTGAEHCASSEQGAH